MLIFFHMPPGSESILPNLSILAAVLPADPAALEALALGLMGIAILVRGRGALRDTTLWAAWWWTLAGLGMVTGTAVIVECGLPQASLKLRQALEFAAAMTTFCPLMALLGAKRPQHRAWQWIVLSLWVVLALPSGEWLLFNTGQEIHAARSWFLAVLVGLGALNYLPTRYCLAGLLFAAAQVALVARFLPACGSVSRLPPQWALLLIVAALALAAWTPEGKAGGAEPLDRVWRDFRNLFGTVWALRVAERINSAAQQNGWKVRLDWSGFHALESPAQEPISAEIRGPLTKTLRSLLLPFVAPQWIARRLESFDPPLR